MVTISFRDTFQKLLDFLKSQADTLGLTDNNIIAGNPQANLTMKSPSVAVFATPYGEVSPVHNAIGKMDVAIFIVAKAESTIIGTVSASVELADKVYMLLKSNFPLIDLAPPEEVSLYTNNTVMLITGQLPYRRIE